MNNWKVILVADDDENDVFFLRRAFTKSGFLHTIIHVSDGQKAIDYLLGSGTYANRDANPFPDLLLLDLKMPRTDGFGVLASLQSLAEIQLPVVVLSTSALPADVQTAKKLGALDYIVKPVDHDEMMKVVMNLHECWLSGAPAKRSNSAQSVILRRTV